MAKPGHLSANTLFYPTNRQVALNGNKLALV